jgi:hypothetical protein
MCAAIRQSVALLVIPAAEIVIGLEVEQIHGLLDVSRIRTIQQCAHEQATKQSGRATQLLGDDFVKQNDRPLVGSLGLWEDYSMPRRATLRTSYAPC